MRVLITAAATAHAYTVKALLETNNDIILGDHADLPQFMLQSKKLLKTPNPAGNAFAHSMLSFCLDNQITKVYPLRRAELLPLAQARQLFAEYGIYLCLPQLDIVKKSLVQAFAPATTLAIVESAKVLAANADFEKLNNAQCLTDGVFGVSFIGDFNLFIAD